VDGRHLFPSRDGLPIFLRTEDEALLRDAEAYAAAWNRDALAPPKGLALELPFVASPYWRPKARSLQALLEILGPANGRRVADMGAGTGWLSYRLSEAGFRCYATDIVADGDVGLGAAQAYDRTGHQFERAVASLSRWPFRAGSMDIAVCNASLHYLASPRVAIAEAARVLTHTGSLVVMNDPVHADRRSAERASHDFKDRMRAGGGSGRLLDEHRHFVASELEADLRSKFPKVSRHDPDFGTAFRISRALKSLLLRMELASFPIYVAER
jgi:SAM-dependent methyltransferase